MLLFTVSSAYNLILNGVLCKIYGHIFMDLNDSVNDFFLTSKYIHKDSSTLKSHSLHWNLFFRGFLLMSSRAKLIISIQLATQKAGSSLETLLNDKDVPCWDIFFLINIDAAIVPISTSCKSLQ